MSYSNPTIPLIPSPVGIDKAIQSLQVALSELPWLEKVFGRAYEHKEQDAEGNLIRIPKCYAGSGEYVNVLPNDHFKSMCFFAIRDREFFTEYSNLGQNPKQRQVNIIFWFNLKQIDNAKDYIFTEELKHDVEAIIQENIYTTEIVEYYDERVENIFDGLINEAKYARYTIDDVKTPYLMYPYAGFRFTVNLNYGIEICVE